jgi:hypothetical protein
VDDASGDGGAGAELAERVGDGVEERGHRWSRV